MIYKTACWVDTINVILSNDTVYDTNLVFQTTHMIDRQSKEEIDIHLLPLINKFGCSTLTLVVKMILFANLQDSNRLDYIPTNLI